MPQPGEPIPMPARITLEGGAQTATPLFFKPNAPVRTIDGHPVTRLLIMAGAPRVDGSTVYGQLMRAPIHGVENHPQPLTINPGEEAELAAAAFVRIPQENNTFIDIPMNELSLTRAQVATIDKLKVAVAAVHGDIGRREAAAIAASRMEAEQAMAESTQEAKPTGRLEQVRALFRHIWKHGWWKEAYTARERYVSLAIHEASGLPTHVRQDLRRRAEEEARRRIAEREAAMTQGQRRINRLRQGYHDFEGYFTEVHAETVNVFRQWRTELDELRNTGTTPERRAQILANNPLAPHRLAWLGESHEIAQSIAENMVHGDRGEAVIPGQFLIRKDTELGRRMLSEVVNPFLASLYREENADLARATAGSHLEEIFASNEFRQFLDGAGLTADQRDALLARDYGTNLLGVLEREVLPQVRDSMQHQAGVAACDFDIELTLGIAEWGPRNKVQTSWSERRAGMNRQIYERLRRRENITNELFGRLNVASGVNRARYWGLMEGAAKNELLWAAASYGTIAWATSSLSGIARTLTPLLGGGAISGAIGGFKEFRSLGREIRQTDLERAMGYQFPDRVRVMQRRFMGLGPTVERDVETRRGQLGQFLEQKSMTDLVTPLRQILLDENGNVRQTVSDGDAAQRLFGLVVDAAARNRVSDINNVNLLAADPTSSQSYEAQKRQLDRLVDQGRRALYLSTNVNIPYRQFLESLNPGQPVDPNRLLVDMIDLHAQQLVSSTTTEARYATALGTLSADAARALDARQDAFNRWRVRESAIKGVKTGSFGVALGGGIYWATHLGEMAPLVNPTILSPEANLPIGAGVLRMPHGFSFDAHGNLDYTDTSGVVHDDMVRGLAGRLHYNADGTLDAASKTILTDELHRAGFGDVTIASPAAEPFAADTTTHPLAIGGKTVTAPAGLHFVDDAAGNAAGHQDLVLTIKDSHGNTVDIMVADNVDPNNASLLTTLKGKTDLFSVTEGGAGTTLTTPGHFDHIDGLVVITNAAGHEYPVQAIIPEGYNIQKVGDDWDVVNTKTNGHVITGMRFDQYGKLLNQEDITKQLPKGWEFGGEVTRDLTVAGGAGEKFSGVIDVTAGEMGRRGPWGWLEKFEQAIDTGNPGHKHNAAVNLVKNLFRGYEENVVHNKNIMLDGKSFADGAKLPSVDGHLDYTKMPPRLLFDDLPKGLFSDARIQRIGHVLDEAVQMKEVSKVPLDELHKMAYEIGRVGRVASANEVKRFMELLDAEGKGAGSTVTLHQIEIIQKVAGEGPAVTLAHNTFLNNMVSVTQAAAGGAGPAMAIPIVGRTPLERGVAPSPRYSFGPGTRFPYSYSDYSFGYDYEVGHFARRGPESVRQYVEWLKRSGYYPQEHPYIKDSNGTWRNADGSPITRNVARENNAIRKYLEKHELSYQKVIENFTNSLPTMESECRVSVVIPAYLEGKNIYHTLQEWSQQTDDNGNLLNKKLYEINVIVNGPAGYVHDNTRDEVERFRRDFPDARINLIDTEIPEKKGNVGLARKIITDVILRRSITRSTQSGGLYIESEDADLMEIDKKAIHRLISQYDQDPHLDALRGKQDLSPRILMNNDYLFFDRRVDRITEYLLRDSRLRPGKTEDFDFYWNRITTGGWNTSFTAEAYALIGGYEPVPVGEDMGIGRRISIMRAQKKSNGQLSPNMNTIATVHNVGQSNPRRFIYALLKKIGPYSNFTDEQMNRDIRTMSIDEMMNKLVDTERISDANLRFFEDRLSLARANLYGTVADPAIAEKLFTRLLTSMGFSKYKVVTDGAGHQTKIGGPLKQTGSDAAAWKLDYRIEPDGRVKIDHFGNLQKALENYRRNNQSP